MSRGDTTTTSTAGDLEKSGNACGTRNPLSVVPILALAGPSLETEDQGSERIIPQPSIGLGLGRQGFGDAGGARPIGHRRVRPKMPSRLFSCDRALVALKSEATWLCPFVFAFQQLFGVGWAINADNLSSRGRVEKTPVA